MPERTVIWEKDYRSARSGCKVRLALLADGQLDISFEDFDGQHWDEQLSDTDTGDLFEALKVWW